MLTLARLRRCPVWWARQLSRIQRPVDRFALGRSCRRASGACVRNWLRRWHCQKELLLAPCSCDLRRRDWLAVLGHAHREGRHRRRSPTQALWRRSARKEYVSWNVPSDIDRDLPMRAEQIEVTHVPPGSVTKAATRLELGRTQHPPRAIAASAAISRVSDFSRQPDIRRCTSRAARFRRTQTFASRRESALAAVGSINQSAAKHSNVSSRK